MAVKFVAVVAELVVVALVAEHAPLDLDTLPAAVSGSGGGRRVRHQRQARPVVLAVVAELAVVAADLVVAELAVVAVAGVLAVVAVPSSVSVAVRAVAVVADLVLEELTARRARGDSVTNSPGARDCAHAHVLEVDLGLAEREPRLVAEPAAAALAPRSRPGALAVELLAELEVAALAMVSSTPAVGGELRRAGRTSPTSCKWLRGGGGRARGRGAELAAVVVAVVVVAVVADLVVAAPLDLDVLAELVVIALVAVLAFSWWRWSSCSPSIGVPNLGRGGDAGRRTRRWRCWSPNSPSSSCSRWSRWSSESRT